MNMSKPTAVENLSTTPIRTIELSKKIDLINLIPDLPADQVFSWVRNNQGLVAWGINTKENFSGTERFSRAHKWWKEFVDNCSIRDEVLTSSSGAIAFVSFSYLAESSSVVVVPEVVVGQNSDKTWLTVIGDIDIEKIQAAIYAPKEVAKSPVNLTWTKGSISIEEWQKGVEKAVTRINNKELDKVVLARDLNAQADEVIDPRYVLTKFEQFLS
jgi:menaquinone-specific isochorismate synthase